MANDEDEQYDYFELDYQFFHSAVFQLICDADTGEWRIRGKALDENNNDVEIKDEFLPYFVDNFETHKLAGMRYTYLENTDPKNERYLDAINFLEFVMLMDENGIPYVYYMGFNESYLPPRSELDDFVHDNYAAVPGDITRDKFADLLRSENFEFFVPKPNAELAQHALAIANFCDSGKQWLHRQTGALAAWQMCTPQVQLMVRLLALMEKNDSTAKIILGVVRRYMKVPISPYANGDMLRVVHVHFSDYNAATTLLNLFIAHANGVPSDDQHA